MEKIPPIVEKYIVPLIWVQKDDEQPIGPFMIGNEAGKAAGIKRLTNISHALNNRKKIDDYLFYYKGKKVIILHIPNVRYAKENRLLKTARSFTHEIIEYNMTVCGFEVVEIGEHNGSKTKITAKCCNINCNNTTEKRYNTYISEERLPLCEPCASIIKSINISKKRPILAIKDSERIELESVNEASRQLNIKQQTVYNCLKAGRTHSSGYRFEFLD